MNRMLFLRLLRGVLTAHAGGLGLISLAMLVEGQALTTLITRLPGLWALIGGVLTLVGAAVAVGRLVRERIVLGLGTLGVGPARLVPLAGLVGLLAGLPAVRVVDTEVQPSVWRRVPGAWVSEVAVLPDRPGPVVVPPLTPALHPERAANHTLAAVAGVGLGLYTGPAAILVSATFFLLSDVLSRGLVERGLLPMGGLLLPGLLSAAPTLLWLWWRRTNP